MTTTTDIQESDVRMWRDAIQQICTPMKYPKFCGFCGTTKPDVIFHNSLFTKISIKADIPIAKWKEPTLVVVLQSTDIGKVLDELSGKTPVFETYAVIGTLVSNRWYEQIPGFVLSDFDVKSCDRVDIGSFVLLKFEIYCGKVHPWWMIETIKNNQTFKKAN